VRKQIILHECDPTCEINRAKIAIIIEEVPVVTVSVEPLM
jgi:hypothetical protein